MKLKKRNFSGSFSLLFFMFLYCASLHAETQNADDKGKELYQSYGCALCHGWEGRGDGINAQKYVPPPTNFHDIQKYLHGSDRDSIRRSIRYGIKEDNSVMPAFEHIPPDELDQLITYLQSIQDTGLSISNAWVQAMPPSETTTAAYMTVFNHTAREIVLRSATCDLAGAAELHQMSRKNGMMHMAMVPEILIPANGSVDFEKSGYHIMLIDLKKPVNKGDTVVIKLHFQEGRDISVEAQVRDI